ncbi:MAG: phosphoglycerate mutase, partial [Candidatus Omnitrophota bacterium]
LYIHLKGPDEPAHDGNFIKKKEVIEAIDSFFFGKLLTQLELKDVIICVTADHSTPCILRAHSADPVPILISGGNIKGNGTKLFTEEEARRGKLGELNGIEVLPRIIEFASL